MILHLFTSFDQKILFMTGKVVTKKPTLTVIMAGEFLAERLSSVSGAE
jgi:hypothetical protein